MYIYFMSTKTRGFASMPKDKQRIIASNAGKKAHAIGKAHQFTKQEAAAAGRIGGSRKKNYKSTNATI
jgi:uncharacterized protein